MPTTIESMTGVAIKSPFFNDESMLELFPLHPKVAKTPSAPFKNRVALVYGPNGSGKSTIAQGFREYINSENPRTVNLCPYVGTTYLKLSPEIKPEKFFVFDETYISQNVKVHENGLGSIVLFGQQIQIENRLEELVQEIGQAKTNLETQADICKKYADATDVASPQYWVSLITKKLRDSGGWAETSGIRIKKNQIKTRVTDSEITRLGELIPVQDETATQMEFNRLFSIFDATNSAAMAIEPTVPIINIPDNIAVDIKQLLSKIPNRPQLTQKEQDLLNLMGVAALSTARGFLSVSANSICPTCLQPISEAHSLDMLERIEKILNREVEEFRSELQSLLLPEIPQDSFLKYEEIDSLLVGKIQRQVSQVNDLIAEYNSMLQAKLDDPFSVVHCKDSNRLIESYHSLDELLSELERKRLSFNQVVADKKATEKELLKLNDTLGHYAIRDNYAALLTQREKEKKDLHVLQTTQRHVYALLEEQQELNAQRQNHQIAVDQINKSLSYIFCSKQRLEIRLDCDQLYHLKVNGQPVLPNKISCGERNALALCYFFTEIAKETELTELYKDEMFLVIDDPVSSFDVENRVGILSFLRYKLSQVLSACPTTKVLLMTHDVSVLYDIEKAMSEISGYCAANGCHAEYVPFQLQDKKLIEFKYNSHNEYTRLLEYAYSFACAPTDALDLTIGNILRRVLEAFSTFSFKKGIEQVSLDNTVLGLISDEHIRSYFQNSMYRLVLNNQSHYQEAVRGIPEMSFFSHLSTAEKQRASRDVLCFMYSTNPIHVLSHLPAATSNIKAWLSDIQTNSPQ